MTVAGNKVLFVLAHADDETLLAGALIAKLAGIGNAVTVLCLAPGDADRNRRLHRACEILGVSKVETSRYAEGAMWPDEAQESSSPRRADRTGDRSLEPVLGAAPIPDLAARIGGRIAELDPDVVITHSHYGDYGHADHAVTNLATALAFESAAGQRARLYALAWPKGLVALNARLMKLGGRDLKRMGPDGRFDLSKSIRSGLNASPTVSINVGSKLGLRREASQFYAKEISKGPLAFRLLEGLPIRIQKIFLGKARLTLLRSPAGFDAGNATSGELL